MESRPATDSGAPAPGGGGGSFFDLLREPAISVRLHSGWRLGRSEDGRAFTATNAEGFEIPVGPVVASRVPATELLAAGAPLARLRDAALAAGGSTEAAGLVLWVQRLAAWGLVEFVLIGEDGERGVVAPQWAGFAPELAPEIPAGDRPLGRFAFLRRSEAGWTVESPLAGARLLLGRLSYLEAPVVRRFLAAAGFLAEEPAGARGEALRMWEFHDLAFHMRHTVGWHRDPMGAQFPWIGEIAPAPASRPAWSGARISLPRAPEGREGFASVLERRRSERKYDEDHPISLADLGALLDRAARIRDSSSVVVENGYGRKADFEITRRPYPNGGASYELEIYPVVDRCADLASGLYHYDAKEHALVLIRERNPDLEAIFESAHISTARQAHPQIVLAIAARFARVMWKYRSISYAVILRNTGALYQTLYLAATELGLSPCGIGAADAALFARATGLDPFVEGGVGEFILGGRPATGRA